MLKNVIERNNSYSQRGCGGQRREGLHFSLSLAAAQAKSLRQVSANDSNKEAGVAVKAQGFREHRPCWASATFFKIFEILLILDFVEAVAKLRDGIHGGYWWCSEKSRTQSL